MPRKKCYGSEAEKQAAYRLRKKEAKVESEPRETDEVPIGGTGIHGIECTCLKKEFPCPFHFNYNLPVPVLADAVCKQKSKDESHESGEARESTPSSTNDDKLAPLATKAAPPNADSDSRGGRTLSPTDQKFEEDRPWLVYLRKIRKREELLEVREEVFYPIRNG